MTTRPKFVLLIFLIIPLLLGFIPKPDWGFFGHRKINRMAVFTLPQEMLGFYKKNIEFITRESVAPDKRRYALPVEGVRHYIDLDHFDYDDYTKFPRELEKAIAFNSNIYWVEKGKDSLLLMKTNSYKIQDTGVIENKRISIDIDEFIKWNKSLLVFGQREDYHQAYSLDDVPNWLNLKSTFRTGEIVVVDKFSEYGVGPYFIENMFNRLVSAFKSMNGKSILWQSTELGHYLSDIHVPLHTTENYNGALTDQVGIHAFWETRLPELYADSKYDFMVGKSKYISNPNDFIWETVFKSHRLVADVLGIEKQLSLDFPDDQQYCYEERNNRTIRLECEEFANAYHEAMGGMVEERMRESILAVGSFWFSAWVAAGQPDLSAITEDLNAMAVETAVPSKALEKNKVRQHNED